MEKSHDTFTDLHLGTPAWFTILARLLPVGLLTQFLSAGVGVFSNPDMLGLHATLGIGFSLIAVALLAGALTVRRLRGFGWWAGLVVVLYLVQIGLAGGGNPVPLSLHPANGALLLAASLVLLAKVERRRAQPAPA